MVTIDHGRPFAYRPCFSFWFDCLIWFDFGGDTKSSIGKNACTPTIMVAFPESTGKKKLWKITNTGRSNFHLNFSRPDSLQVTVLKESWGGDNGKPRNLYTQKKKLVGYSIVSSKLGLTATSYRRTTRNNMNRPRRRLRGPSKWIPWMFISVFPSIIIKRSINSVYRSPTSITSYQRMALNIKEIQVRSRTPPRSRKERKIPPWSGAENMSFFRSFCRYFIRTRVQKCAEEIAKWLTLPVERLARRATSSAKLLTEAVPYRIGSINLLKFHWQAR